MINESKRWLIPGAIILGALILTVGVFWSNSACSYKIATVDIQEIEVKSEFSKELNQAIQEKGKELSEKFKTAKNDEEKQAINSEFESFRNQKQKEFTERIKDAIGTVAKKQGFKGVASNQVYIYSAYDITADVIKELGK